MFPAEIYRAPRSWGERAFGNLIYWNEVEKGGHFAAWEQPASRSGHVQANGVAALPLADPRV